MKSGVLLISFVSLLLFCFLTPFGHQKTEWQGSIEQEDGVTVIKNPEEPLFGKIELELEEDLVIGHEEDENFRFYKWISLDVDSDGNITKIIEKDEPAEKITNRERDKIIDVLMGNIKSRPSSTQLARGELEKRVLISKFRPFFEELRIDEHGNIYAQRLNSYLNEDKRYEFDVFNAEGRHTYRLRVPAGVINLRIIKGGYVFSAPYNQESGYFQVKRYKIKNWDPLN